MSRPHLLRASVLVATALAALLVAPLTGAATAAPGASDPSAKAAATTVTFKPAQTTAYVPNTLRGQYRWLSGGPSAGYAAPDLYFRDYVPWSRLEPQRGTYDLSPIEDGLTWADQDGGRLGFRVMAWCPQCPAYAGKDFTQNEWSPSFLPKQVGDTVPDWNSSTFLDAWDELWDHLGAAYADDPRLGWIDVGGFGDFGEFHARRGPYITPANAKRLAAAVLDNFPDTQVVVNAMDPTLTNALLSTSPRLGLRTDCLGAPATYSLLGTAAPGSLIAERWRTAPVLSEWCSYYNNLDTVRGAKQVTKYHVSQVGSGFAGATYGQLSPAQQKGFRQSAKLAGYRLGVTTLTVPTSVAAGGSFPSTLTWTNSGSAPVYEDWDVSLVLEAPDGSTTRQPIAKSLRKVLPGSKAWKLTAEAPSAPGRYTLRLVVEHPGGRLAPMALSNTGRLADGSYPLGSIVVR